MLFLSRGKMKNLIFCKNSRLETRPDFVNTSPGDSHYGFASNSTTLSPITNSESYRYHYPVCPAKAGPPSIPYPDSKAQREALDCPPRGPLRPPRSCSGFSRRKSKILLFGFIKNRAKYPTCKGGDESPRAEGTKNMI